MKQHSKVSVGIVCSGILMVSVAFADTPPTPDATIALPCCSGQRLNSSTGSSAGEWIVQIGNYQQTYSTTKTASAMYSSGDQPTTQATCTGTGNFVAAEFWIHSHTNNTWSLGAVNTNYSNTWDSLQGVCNSHASYSVAFNSDIDNVIVRATAFTGGVAKHTKIQGFIF